MHIVCISICLYIYILLQYYYYTLTHIYTYTYTEQEKKKKKKVEKKKETGEAYRLQAVNLEQEKKHVMGNHVSSSTRHTYIPYHTYIHTYIDRQTR